MNSGIYEIVHVESQNRYVGQAKNVNDRIWEHKRLLNNGYHFNSHLQSAWNKYGESAFEFNVLEYSPVDLLTTKEQAWIDFLRVEGICYNQCPIASSTRGRKLTKEHKMKIGEAGKKQKLSDEHIRALQEGRKRANPNLNVGASNPNSKAVAVDGVEYETMREAYQATGITGKTIKRRILSGVKGYYYVTHQK